MWTKIKDWLIATLSEVEAERHDLAQVLRASLLVGASLSLVAVSGALVMRSANWERLLRDGSLVLVLALLLWLALRAGYVRLAAYGTILGFTVFAAFAAYTGLGVRGTSYALFTLIVMVAGLFLNRRASYLMALLASLVGLGLLWASRAGWLTHLNQPLAEPATWLIQVCYFFIAAVILDIASRQTSQALKQTRRALDDRTRAEAEVRRLNAELESHIADRTAQLAASEERYRLISSISSDYVFVTEVTPTGELRHNWTAGAFESIMGYTFEEYLARGGWLSVLHPDDVARDAEGIATLRANQPTSVELRIIPKSGVVRWVRVSVRPGWDEAQHRLTRIYGAVQDITALKQAEAQLRLEKERLDAFLSNSAVIAWLKDEAGRHVYVSRNYEQRYNVRLEAVRGQTDFDIWPAEIAETFRRNDQAVLAGGQSIEVVEETIEANGSHTWWLNNKFVFVDEQGQRYVGGLGVDITERRQAEAAWRRSEDLYRRAIMAAGAVPYYLDYRTGAYTFMGEGILEMTGYSAAEMNPTLWNSLEQAWFPRGALAHLTYAEADRLTDEGVYRRWECDYRILTRTGQTRWVADTSLQIRDEQDVRIGVIGILQDITERKQAEAALREKEQLYRELFAQSMDGVLLTQPTGEILYANPAACALFGYTEAELQTGGRGLVIDRNDPRLPGLLAERQRTGRARGELTFIRRNGTPFEGELSSAIFIIPNGQSQTSMFIRDITARKQAEVALREAEARYRELVERLPVVVYTSELGATGVWRYTSPQIEALSGFTPQEWMANPNLWDQQVHPADRDNQNALEEQAYARGETFDAEYRLFTRAGQEVWVRDTAHILPGRDGALPIVQGVLMDITERKRAVEALRQSEQSMREFQEKLKALHEISLELATTPTLDDLHRRAVELGRAQLGLDRFAIFLLDETAETILGTFGTDAQGHLRDERHMRRVVTADSAIQGVINDKARVRVWQDAPLWDDWGIIGRGWNALAAIWDGDQAIGWLATDNLLRQEPLPPYLAELLMLYGAAIGSLHRRKQSEAALAQERDLLQALMDNIPDSIYFKDTASRLTRVNRGFTRMLNVADPQAMLGRTDFDFQTPLLAQAFFDEEQAMLHSGQPIVDRIEFNPTTAGQPRWLSATKVPIRDQAGQVIGLVGVSRDVTEREVTRQLLAKQTNEMATMARVSAAASTVLNPTELLQTVVDLTNQSFGLYHTHIYLLSADGQTLTVAAGAGDVGRQMRAEGWHIPLAHAHSLVARVARTRQGALLNAAQQSPDFLPNPRLPKTQAEIAVPIITGEQLLGVFDVQSASHAGFSEAEVAVYTALARQLAVALQNARLFELAQTEIRERQKAETLIRQRAEEFETLYQLVQTLSEQNDLAPLLDTIAERARLLLKAENGFVFLYDPATNELEYRVSRVIPAHGQRMHLGEGVAGRVAQTRQPMMVDDYHVWSGRVATYEDWPIAANLGVPMLYNGALVGVLGVENYTPNPNKFAEADARLLTLFAAQAAAAVSNTQALEQIRQNAAELEARVAARTEELRRANDNLAQAARLKDEFLASMSHELRTPLTGILAFAQTLQKPKIYGALNEKQLKAVHTIEDSGKHLLELINDILDLAKLEAGKFELEFSPVTVEEIAQASLRLVRQMALTKRQTLSYSLNPLDLSLLADGRRLKQMLVNLLSNAVKFTPEGEELGLEITADAAQGVARFTVWDKGIGIAPENFERLFQAFVQIDARLARQYEGTGLGLALVRRMSELHGGSISVESTPGQGSRFTITLPWQSPDTLRSAATPAAFISPPTAAWPRQALTVEDSAIAAEQLTDQLTALGIANRVYALAEGVVEEAAAMQPGVIFLDLFLPDASGWNVLTNLQADPRTRAIPVVIVSVIEERAHAAQLGATDYLVKPLERAALEQTLQRVWARAPQATPPPALIVAPRAARPCLLLAEDNPVNAQVLRDYLEATGYQILVAHDGSEAVYMAREKHPQLILMDIQMPGMDGLEATRHLRRDPALAQVPIIALTALAMPGDRERCLAAGANEYLTKPVNLEQLLEVIRTLLG